MSASKVKLKAVIEQCDNGWLLTLYDNFAEPRVQEMVYQDKAKEDFGDPCTFSHVIDCFYEIAEWFGLPYSKHERHNLMMQCECEILHQEELDRA